MHEKKELVVEGFQFNSHKDAEAARAEQDKVKLLESRLDYANPDQVRIIYEKAIQNRIFKTPIGYTYLHTLQKYLRDYYEEDEVRSVPLFVNYIGSMRNYSTPAKKRVEPQEAEIEPAEKKLKRSRVLNFLLILTIIVMFIINFYGETPNILNYEHVIVNRYAAWEQELTQRENVIREKEHELDMESTEKTP